MTKVKINPGVCGLTTTVSAEADEDLEVTLKIESKCPAVQKMFSELGNTYDAYEVCLCKPGENEFYTYAKEHFPGHSSCPTIAGIVKCIEVEAHLALPRPVSITFEE